MNSAPEDTHSSRAGRGSGAQKRFIARPHRALLLFSSDWRDLVIDEITEILDRRTIPAAPAANRDSETPLSGAKIVDDGTGPIIIDDLPYRKMIELALSARMLREVLWIVEERRVGSLGEVTQVLSRIPWEWIFPAGAAISLRGHIAESYLNHEGALIESAERALTRAGYVIADDAPQKLDLRIERNRLRVCISFSGSALYRRGYKRALSAHAPLREDLAAAAIRLAVRETRPHGDGSPSLSPPSLFIPFAGSGTLGFEAVLTFTGISPALFPHKMPFEDFLCTPSPTVAYLRSHALPDHTRQSASASELLFVENDDVQHQALRANCESFSEPLRSAPPGTIPKIRIAHQDFFSLTKNDIPTGSLFVALNPPWGERLELEVDSERLYRRLGAHLRTILGGRRGLITGVVIAPDANTLARFLKGFTPDRSMSRPARSGGRPIVIGVFSRAEQE